MDWDLFWRKVGYVIYVVGVIVVMVPVGIVVAPGQVIGAYLVPMCQVATGRRLGLTAPFRALALPADRDPAVVDYLHGPVRIDLAYVRQLAVERLRERYTAWTDRISAWCNPDPDELGDRRAREQRRMALPGAVGLSIGLGVGAVVGAATAALLAGLHEVVAGVMSGCWRGIGLVLWTVDSVLLRVRHIRMRCLACFERLPYPAYRCPDCNETHWDIRPGASGIVMRTCLCGRRLPTLLMFGSGALAARCPFRLCGSEMEHRPGTVVEEVLPVFGATGAGKTRLMYALVVALQQMSDRHGVSLRFADSWTERQLATARMYLDGTMAVVGTPPALQRGIALNLRIGRRQRLLQFFDAAGERFYSEERSSDLLYLGSGRTFLLVVDPLAVDGFWEGLPPQEHSRLAASRPLNVPQPDLAYQQTVERVVDLHGDPARSRLAVVFSRADMLGAAGGGSNLEGWVQDRLGLGGLLRTARLDFREVTLFRTAAVLRGEEIDPSVADLLSWMLLVADQETRETKSEIAA